MSHHTIRVARRTAALVLAAACARYSTSARIERAAVTPDVLGAEAAVYFTLRMDGSDPDTIVGLSIAEARSVSMQVYRAHRVTGEPAIAPSMMAVDWVPVTASGTVRFGPGGYTGLISGLRRAVAPGDSVLLTVKLARGRGISAMAPVLRFDDLESVLDPEAASVSHGAVPTAAEGAKLYRANGCASCHGALGHGDGPVGRDLVPPPRDFRVAASFKGGIEPEQIARTLAIGVPGGGSMPLFAHLTNHERRALALYLVTLRTPTPDQSSTP